MMRNTFLSAFVLATILGCNDHESTERTSDHPNKPQAADETHEVDDPADVRPGPWVSLFDGPALDGAALDGAALDGTAVDGAVLNGAVLDGTVLDGIDVTLFGGEGEVWVKEGQLILEPGMLLTGIGWPDLKLPPEFELEVTAARLSGTDFFCALTVPIGDEYATVVLGGWGGAITGLSCVDGEDASENETRTFRDYKDGTDYTLRVQVTADVVSATVDDQSLFSVSRDGRRFEVRPEVFLSRPVGIASFATRAAISNVRWRALADVP